MKLSKRARNILFGIAAVIVAIALGLWAADALIPSVVRRALPATASEVHEYYNDSGFTGDFLRCLKAKMPQSEMPRFAAKLGLAQRYDPRKDAKSPVSFSAADGISWWSQPKTLNGAYFKYTPGSESYSVATYQDGYVYFLAIAW